MKIYYFLLTSLSIGACSNQPHVVNISSNYEYGFTVSNTPEIINELKSIGDLCIELDTRIEQTQPIMRKDSDWFHFVFDVQSVVDILNQFINCSDQSSIIRIMQLETEGTYFGRGRYDGYRVDMKVMSKYVCGNKKYTHTNITHAGLDNNSFSSDKKLEAIIASTVVLAFYKNISETFERMIKDCE